MRQDTRHTHSFRDMNAWIKFAVKAAITMLLLWLQLKWIDLRKVLDSALDVDWHYLVAAVCLSLFLAWLASVRWFFVIRAIGHKLSFGLTWQFTMIGVFFNQILPSAMGGDLVRIPYAHNAGLPFATALKSVVLDRVMAFVGQMVLVILCLPMVYWVVTDIRAQGFLMGVCVACILGTGLVLGAERSPQWLHRQRIFILVLWLSRSLRGILLGSLSMRIVVSAVMVHVVRVLTVYLIATGMSLHVSLLQCLILVPPAMLLTLLPVSVGGWGVREGAFVVAFAFIGLPAAQSFALSTLFGLMILFSSLTGALVWIFLRNPIGKSRGDGDAFEGIS